ncbi:DDE domain-containing protein [Belnapia rosea]|uniref:DDE domain-containing protein n=1 Tax=Belnapia rosea TaxID=938405 RepID=A0A1G7E1L6_9PROT|nr:DDE domain-containing protein [Belnapia rosea]
MRPDQSFKGRQFTAEVILWAIRWYLMFPVSYRDLELMLADRGVEVAHTTVFRWVRTYAPEIEKRIRLHLRLSNGSWRVDETYIRVKARWMYLYRAVDSRGQTIDFLLSAKRVARRGGCKALLPQGSRAAAYGEPAHDHRGQEPGLPLRRHRDEGERRVVALLSTTTMQAPQ